MFCPRCDSREWYTNGDYLVLLVTLVIILPLSLLRNLGKQSLTACAFLYTFYIFILFVRNILSFILRMCEYTCMGALLLSTK